MTTELPALDGISNLVVFHAPEDQPHFMTFARALYEQPRASSLRIIPLCPRGRLLGLQPTITQFMLNHADAVVFLSKPRDLQQLEQLRRAKLTARDGERVPTFEVCGTRTSELRQLACQVLDQLVPSRPIHEVLCMFASPHRHEQLALHREWRAIDDVNNQAGKPLALASCWAARVHDLQDALLQQPWDLLHFSGHGEPGNVFFETADGYAHAVPTEHLIRALAEHQPQCLVFNTCHSADMLIRLRDRLRVPHVIAMQGSTDDLAAIEFSRALYAALARGRSVMAAFEHAFGGLGLHGHAERCRPRLWNFS